MSTHDPLRQVEGVWNRDPYDELYNTPQKREYLKALKSTSIPIGRKHRKLIQTSKKVTAHYVQKHTSEQPVIGIEAFIIIPDHAWNNTTNQLLQALLNHYGEIGAAYVAAVNHFIWRANRILSEYDYAYNMYLLCHEWVHAHSYCEFVTTPQNEIAMRQTGLWYSSMPSRPLTKNFYFNEAVVDSIARNIMNSDPDCMSYLIQLCRKYDESENSPHDVVLLQNGEKMFFDRGYVDSRRAYTVLVEKISRTNNMTLNTVNSFLEKYCILGNVIDLNRLLDSTFSRTVRNRIAEATSGNHLLKIMHSI